MFIMFEFMSYDLLLNLKDFVCGYVLQKVVQDFDLYFNVGDIGCLLGFLGCGKIIILCVIVGFELVLVGQIELGGEVILCFGFILVLEKCWIGMVFQDYVLFFYFSVVDNVGFGICKYL